MASVFVIVITWFYFLFCYSFRSNFLPFGAFKNCNGNSRFQCCHTIRIQARHKCTVTHSKAKTCCNLCMLLVYWCSLALSKTVCGWGCYFTYFITIFIFHVCAQRPSSAALAGWLVGCCYCCCFSYKNQLYFLVTVTRYMPKATWLLDLIVIRAQYVHKYRQK